jgi:hypothetical protein
MNLRFSLLLLISSVVVMLAACSGCGSEATMRRHAVAAQVVHDVSVGAREAVLASLAADVAEATDGVTDPAERARLAAEVRDRYTRPGGPIDAANAVNRAGLAYVRALLVVEQDEHPSWSQLGPPLVAALDAYAELRRVVGGDRLPELPATVTGLVTP